MYALLGAKFPSRLARTALILGGVCVIAAALAYGYHATAVRREQIGAAKARLSKLDAARREVAGMGTQFVAYFKKLDSDRAVAETVATKRHDDYYSLSVQELYDLARDERVRVGAAEDVSREIDALDQDEFQVYAQLFGEAAVAPLRASSSQRNEALQEGYSMWWRAAQDNEDIFKAELNGGGNSTSEDEIARDYDESSKDLTHVEQLQLTVDREATDLSNRLNREWSNAKADLKRLGAN